MRSATVEVQGSWLQYVEVGAGDPVLFLHGNPTSSYLWRNVIGAVARAGRRCIALDLIGMGGSGKPTLDYRLVDHLGFVEAFVEALELSDLTLVGHDWGAVIALDHARRFRDRVRGVAFMEGHLRPIARWSDMDEGSRGLFQRVRTPGVGEQLIIQENFFVEEVLPAGILRTLSQEELDAYRAPYRDPAARLPVWRWPQEIPIEGAPADVAAIVTANQAVLADPDLPKLLLHANPGAVIGPAEVAWCREHGQALTIVDLGPGTHFLPEDRPTEIATALNNWLSRWG
ncbi:haloalkane dehalogenase [Kribbella albertanoniae]|uniref:Haloalkane dehalogenase n=1 Tax=Kribbella albertanoniae TaxID=1266829 RepID=A0A4R4Q2U5_9ACTN|nr:haloalkane dehalogenase [Kribbella albertanoniae]TDC29346.1 haloalkane dehalogenase [Kribbella albertanoniae]